MKIYPNQPGSIGPDKTRTSSVADSAASEAIRAVRPTPSSVERSDRVSISDAGRALAARDGGPEAATLDPARAARIRDRVLSGAYDTLEVVDAVARRLLDSGDI
jgi:negative regulator of flagellin synthesis FlgM